MNLLQKRPLATALFVFFAGFFLLSSLPLIAKAIMSFVTAFRIFKEVYFIVGAYPNEPLMYTLQNYMNNMYKYLNYQNVTTAAYIFAVIVFVLFGLLFLSQRKALKRLGGD